MFSSTLALPGEVNSSGEPEPFRVERGHADEVFDTLNMLASSHKGATQNSLSELEAVEREVMYLAKLENTVLSPLVEQAFWASRIAPEKKTGLYSAIVTQTQAHRFEEAIFHDSLIGLAFQNMDTGLVQGAKTFREGAREHIIKTVDLATKLVPDQKDLRAELECVRSTAHGCKKFYHANLNT